MSFLILKRTHTLNCVTILTWVDVKTWGSKSQIEDWWWWCVLQDFKLSSTDVGALWNVPDVTLPALTTSVPSSTSHTESDSGCSYEQHPSPTTLPSSLSNSVDSLSPTESLVQSPKQIYPKINITYGQSNKLNSKKGQVRYWVKSCWWPLQHDRNISFYSLFIVYRSMCNQKAFCPINRPNVSLGVCKFHKQQH